MARQGWSMSEMEVRRIAYLLSETDLAVAAIAERMDCSKSAIMSINRRFQIRDYGKHRNRWNAGPELKLPVVLRTWVMYSYTHIDSAQHGQGCIKGQRDMPKVTIVPKTGDINKQFGVYSNVCCGYEIIIREGASFPNCPNHRKSETTWNFVETEKIQQVIIRKQSQSNPAA